MFGAMELETKGKQVNRAKSYQQYYCCCIAILLGLLMSFYTVANTNTQDGWIFCANEQEICLVAAPSIVRYGAADQYEMQYVEENTTCNNTVFGDPIPGTVKTCAYQLSVDNDFDNDGVLDSNDAFPSDETETKDTDNDGVGDNADAFPLDANNGWVVCASEEGVCRVPVPSMMRYGANGQYVLEYVHHAINCDNDELGDPIPGTVKTCAYLPSALEDYDNDGTLDSHDAFPNDPTETIDTDGDGIGNNNDPFLNDATNAANQQWYDCVGEGLTCKVPVPAIVRFGIDGRYAYQQVVNAIECQGGVFGDPYPGRYKQCSYLLSDTVDYDKDGVVDADDVFPSNANESLDSDGDGIGDNADVFPEDASNTSDGNWLHCSAEDFICEVPAPAMVRFGTDDRYAYASVDQHIPCNNSRFGDPYPGQHKKCSYLLSNTVDYDNDGVLDSNDAFPGDPTETKDTDNDGVGDNVDPFPSDADNGWTFCADEQGTCRVPIPATVRYGAQNQYVLQSVEYKTSCSNEVFTDPIPGTVKTCAYLLSAVDDFDNDGVVDSQDTFPANANEFEDTDGDGIGNNADPFPNDTGNMSEAGWYFCALENYNCTLPAPAMVRFGIDGRFSYSLASGVIACRNDNFGDPYPGQYKHCSYMLSDTFDFDNDGVFDSSDAFPNDPTETTDTDGDGVGDNADPFPEDANNGWTFCANEEEICSVPAASTVRYGADNQYAIHFVEQTIRCDNTAFSDPIPGIEKNCAYLLSAVNDADNDGVVDSNDAFPNDPTETLDTDGDGFGNNTDPFPEDITNEADKQWQLCATEGLSCEVPVPALVRFGTDYRFAYAQVTETIACRNSLFGDPYPGRYKQCSYLLSDTADYDGDGIVDSQDPDPATPQNGLDVIAPTIELAHDAEEIATSASISIRGTAIDPLQTGSGIAEVNITSDQYATNVFTGQYDNTTNEFVIEVALQLGSNQLVVTAIDLSGNQFQQSIIVTRISPPQFSNVFPVDNAVITTDTVSFQGEIHTDLAVDAFTFSLNETQIIPESTATNGVYQFTANGFPLVLGYNEFSLRLHSSNYHTNQRIRINYIPDNSENIPAPVINQIVPANNTIVNQESFQLSAFITSSGGALSVKVNDSQILAAEQGITSYQLLETIQFTGNEKSTSVTITATDSLNKTSNITVNYSLDNTAPVIQLDNDLKPFPEINEVNSPTYTLSGIVNDTYLSSFLINNQPVTIEPTEQLGEYRFSVNSNLTQGEAEPFTLTAFDNNGNRTVVEYMIQNTTALSLSVLIPAQNIELINTGEPIDLQLVSRVDGITNTESVSVYLEGDETTSTTLLLSGTLATGTITLPATVSNTQILVFEIRNHLDQVLQQEKRSVQIREAENVDLQITRIEPSNNAFYVEPNDVIEIYFNQPVELSNLTLTVRETLHGKTYINQNILGADFTQPQGYVLQDVNRDLELVPGQLRLSPGGTSASFTPTRFFGFNSDIFVDVQYKNSELSRSRFKVRELPTFINGSIVDQFGQAIPDISVSIPELQRTTTTNVDGGYAFGYQESGEQLIDGGNYQIIVNNNFANRNYGTINTTIDIQKNRQNTIDRYTIQALDNSIPFQRINSGQDNVLINGDLILDLTDSQALFTNGRTSGDIHIQFLAFEHIGTNLWPGALPLWAYGIQPKGIDVEGETSLTFTIPELSSGTHYINEEDYPYVVLLGYHKTHKVLEPIGVGKVENNKVTSVGSVSLNTLDYLAYAKINPERIQSLKDFADKKITLQQLKATLQNQ